MVTRHYRNDVLLNTARVEYYSFEQAGGYNTGVNGTETIQVRADGTDRFVGALDNESQRNTRNVSTYVLLQISTTG